MEEEPVFAPSAAGARRLCKSLMPHQPGDTVSSAPRARASHGMGVADSLFLLQRTAIPDK